MRAPVLSGIRCATIICVCAALSSMIFRVFPEGVRSKKRKLASVSPSMPLFRRLVSRRKPSTWLISTAVT